MQGQQGVCVGGRPLQRSSCRDNDGFPHHGRVKWQTVPLGEMMPYARLCTQNIHTNQIKSRDMFSTITFRCPHMHAHAHRKTIDPCVPVDG